MAWTEGLIKQSAQNDVLFSSQKRPTINNSLGRQQRPPIHVCLLCGTENAGSHICIISPCTHNSSMCNSSISYKHLWGMSSPCNLYIFCCNSCKFFKFFLTSPTSIFQDALKHKYYRSNKE